MARNTDTDDALSIEVIGRDRLAKAEARAAPTASAAGYHGERWEQLFDAAGLTEEEAAFARVHHVDGVPWRKTGAILRWDRTRVERVRRSVTRLLKKPPSPDLAHYRRELEAAYESSCAGFWEALPSGRRTYSLVRHGPLFVELMAAERPKIIVSKKVSAICHHVGILGTTAMRTRNETGATGDKTEMEQLETKLQAAKLASGRLWAQRGETMEALGAATRRLEATLQEQQRDEEDALAEDRRPQSRLVVAVADAETVVTEAERRMDACERAYKRTGVEIEQIASEIASRRLETTKAKLVDPHARLVAAIHELTSASIDVATILGQSGLGYYDLFPSVDPREPLERITGRGLAVQAYWLGLTIAREEAMFSGRKAVA